MAEDRGGKGCFGETGAPTRERARLSGATFHGHAYMTGRETVPQKKDCLETKADRDSEDISVVGIVLPGEIDGQTDIRRDIAEAEAESWEAVAGGEACAEGPAGFDAEFDSDCELSVTVFAARPFKAEIQGVGPVLEESP